LSIFLFKSDLNFLPYFLKKVFKFNIGNYKLGLIISIISIPIILFIQNKQDKEILAFYPFSKISLKDNKKFILLELLYFLFYYISWEMMFRGFFQNFLLILTNQKFESNIKFFFQDLTNPVFFVLIISICLQTILSTLFHIGHPKSEIFASFFGGFLFGIICFLTNSVIYTIFIHAFLGITTDIFIKIKENKILSRNNKF